MIFGPALRLLQGETVASHSDFAREGAFMDAFSEVYIMLPRRKIMKAMSVVLHYLDTVGKEG